MLRISKPKSRNAHPYLALLLVCLAGLPACSTMPATDTGFLHDRAAMTESKDGSVARYRSATLIDPHQVRAISAEWASPQDADFSSTDKAQLLAALKAAIAQETQALPKVSEGRPVVIRAAITRVESVSPALNTIATVMLIGPFDRGGAAVEIEVLDAETRQPLASLAHGHFAPLSAFKARFSRLAPAELALQVAAANLATLLRKAQ